MAIKEQIINNNNEGKKIFVCAHGNFMKSLCNLLPSIKRQQRQVGIRIRNVMSEINVEESSK